MDEAKHLINMFLSVIFAAGVLLAVSGLIYMSQTFNRHFERQEQQSARMQEYAEYSSYDNKNVRGQEIISLIQEHKDDIFILIYDNATTGNDSCLAQLPVGTTAEDYYKGLSTNTSGLLAFVANPSGGYSTDKMLSSSNMNTVTTSGNTMNQTQVSALTTLCGAQTLDDALQYMHAVTHRYQAPIALYDASNEELIQYFTSPSFQYNVPGTSDVKTVQAKLCGYTLSNEAIAESSNDLTSGRYEGSYAPFHANLIYEAVDSSSVIGIIFTRLPSLK